jgi:hypothetical protein
MKMIENVIIKARIGRNHEVEVAVASHGSYYVSESLRSRVATSIYLPCVPPPRSLHLTISIGRPEVPVWFITPFSFWPVLLFKNLIYVLLLSLTIEVRLLPAVQTRERHRASAELLLYDDNKAPWSRTDKNLRDSILRLRKCIPRVSHWLVQL